MSDIVSCHGASRAITRYRQHGVVVVVVVIGHRWVRGCAEDRLSLHIIAPRSSQLSSSPPPPTFCLWWVGHACGRTSRRLWPLLHIDPKLLAALRSSVYTRPPLPVHNVNIGEDLKKWFKKQQQMPYRLGRRHPEQLSNCGVPRVNWIRRVLCALEITKKRHE